MFKRFTALLIGFLVFVLSACNPGQQNISNPPDFNLLLGSSTLTIIQADSGTVTISINRQNHNGEVALSAEGLPAGVNASFTPSATTGNSSNLELSVDAAVSVGDYPVKIKGESGTLSKEASMTLKVEAPPTVTVAGRVIDAFMGPLAGLPVKIQGMAAVTASDGSFSITGVTTPYDVTVINNGSNIGFVFKDVSRLDPSLQLFDLSALPGKSASISGSLAGGAGFPNPANHRAVVTFASQHGSGRTSVAAGPNYGPMNVIWSGVDTTTGKLHALQWEVDASALPLNYKGYAEKSMSLSDGGTFASPATDLTLSNVAEASLSGTVSLPAGYTSQGRVFYADWGTNSTTALALEATPASGFTYTTPSLPNTTASVLNYACGQGGCVGFNNSSWAFETGLATNATSVSLNNPTIPEPSLPVAAATGVSTSTPFTWTTMNDAVYMVFFEGAGANPDYVVVTQDASATIPDLSAEGLGLPVAANYEWFVFGAAPFSTMDEATAPRGYVTEFFNAYFGLLIDGRGPENSGAFALSKTRLFTTAP